MNIKIKKLITFEGLILLIMLSLSVSLYAEPSDSKNSGASHHFQSHATGAKEFIRLWRQGKELREDGKYNESLEILQHAYEDVAFGRVEQAMVLIESAKTSEAMGNYEVAATFYDGAAQLSMNPVKTDEYNAKSKELRQKLTQ